MDSLYRRSEDTFAKSIISVVNQECHVIALDKVTKVVSNFNLPVSLRPHLLVRALRMLRELESQKNLLDVCFVKYLPHPECGEYEMTLGELWELPLEHEWLCGQCGRPLYDIQKDKD